MAEFFPKKQGLYDSKYEHDSCGIGFVAHIKGQKSHDIVLRGLQVLERMEHRGAESADNKTGDGAGILIQIPHNFLKKQYKDLPDAGTYGSGLVFLPNNKKDAEKAIKEFEKIIESEGLKQIHLRDVPVDDSQIGEIASWSEPIIKQTVICLSDNSDQDSLELKLYIVRKLIEKKMRELNLDFYIPTLSSKTMVYKGMLMPDQVYKYFLDLQDKDLDSAIALVHSRFSTNTFPAWSLAQPFRIVAHNGEINTVKGNRFWMNARESLFVSEKLKTDLSKILPVIEPDRSDSASFDNALEMLVATGRSLPHALMMMIPEVWSDKNPIPQKLKAFYEYHSMFMEPWDGPASIVFCDGRYVGGTLDRNGLRPSRFVITKDDMIAMGSEVGVQEFAPESVKFKGRLQPGKILLVDTEEGRIIPNEEIKDQIASQKPYEKWVNENRVNLSDIPSKKDESLETSKEKLKQLKTIYGYNREDIENLIIPMVENAQEPTGSMGTDTPLAVFSDKPQRLYNYFKQTFAQVTNPAIDPIREEIVMTLTGYIGTQKNLLDETPEHGRMIKYKRPIFSNGDVEKILAWNNKDFKAHFLNATFDKNDSKGLEKALDRICKEAEEKASAGFNVLLISDKKIDEKNAPIPALLASSAIHHHLLRTKQRTQVGIIVQTAEAREVMHFGLLFGFGADAIHPYGAFSTIKELVEEERLKGFSYIDAENNFIKGISKGLLKILSKMGISTLRSYRGSQIFEAVGLGESLIEKYFTGTVSRIGGIGLDEIQKEVLILHKKAYTETPDLLESEGVYRFRRDGEKHAWNPETIHLLQWSTRTNDYQKYKEFSKKVQSDTEKPHFIRGLFDFRKDQKSISIDEVEPAEKIYTRLLTGAMSFGSLSKEAHESMAIALNALGGRSNSGEGGENPIRFKPYPNGDLARSATKQVASGRFGVTSNYLANADEIQIKISQGAKPGEGGQLPGHKVNQIIAKTRFSTPGVTLISPPPHHDIYSIEDLAQLIFDLKNANPNARINVKLVSETGVGTIAAGVAKAHADNILISGFDGGTGASPQSSIKHAGLPFEIGISETHQTLVLNNLRGRVRLQTDGQLKTGRDVVMAALLGAEEFGFGTGALIVLGCIMMRKCHLNTCPVGVATQDPELRKRFRGKPEYLINYFKFLTQEIREIMASLGIKKFDDLIGRSDLLVKREITHWKAKTVDPSAILYRPKESDKYATYCVEDQIHKINDIIDRTLIQKASDALENAKPISIEMPIKNTDRTVGAMLSYEVSKRYEEAGLPEDTIKCTFHGSAGQSFGAFLAKGLTFKVEGDTNDYFGKGLSGGKLVVVPPKNADFKAEENIIIGNTVLYGATSGEVFVRGVAGERFCVRNSGAVAVVEGTGDHCAEYMTGGIVIVLGKTGKNFAAGMSGGFAFVYDKEKDFEFFCNKGMVDLEEVENTEDISLLKTQIEKHLKETGSTVAKSILENWEKELSHFVKVMPIEYKRALEEMKLQKLDEKLEHVREDEELEQTR